MSQPEETTRTRMCVQTSAGAMTVGGHGGDSTEESLLRVASGIITDSGVPGPTVGLATGNASDGTGLLGDTGHTSKAIKDGGTDLLADSDRKTRTRGKRSKETQRTLGRYKAAIRIVERLGNKKSNELSPQDKLDLAWGTDIVAKSRATYENQEGFKSKNSAFANRIEENLHTKIEAKKRQRSIEEEGSTSKKHKQTKTTPERRADLSLIRTASEVVKTNHLLVALIDRSVPYGKISGDRAKVVEMKMLDAMINATIEKPGTQMPAFDSSRWYNDCKLLQCKDQFTLDWIKAEIAKLTSNDLWEGADLTIVPKAEIPAPPKAKVFIPRIVPPEHALGLLRSQNPDVPTHDWKVLHVEKPKDTSGGQFYILQINEEAEQMLYPRYGKMSWSWCTVNLRLKRKKKTESQQQTTIEPEKESDTVMECPDLGNMTIETDIESEMSDEDEIDTTIVEVDSKRHGSES